MESSYKSDKSDKSKAYFRFFNEEYANSEGKLYFTVDYDFIIKDDLWSYAWTQGKTAESLYYNSKINFNDYILCPLYGKIEDDTFSDLQFGVTESYKKDETDTEVFHRSLGEELGLETKRKPYYIRQSVGSNYKFKLNIIDINHTKLLTVPKYSEEEEIKDPNKRKMITIVHGTEKDICNFLNTPNIILDESEDEIVGIVGIKFEDALNYFNINWRSIKKSLRYIRRTKYFLK